MSEIKVNNFRECSSCADVRVERVVATTDFAPDCPSLMQFVSVRLFSWDRTRIFWVTQFCWDASKYLPCRNAGRRFRRIRHMRFLLLKMISTCGVTTVLVGIPQDYWKWCFFKKRCSLANKHMMFLVLLVFFFRFGFNSSNYYIYLKLELYLLL